jgi:TRAP-type mannitol/chloroaromatic compound transport system permease small subunit
MNETSNPEMAEPLSQLSEDEYPALLRMSERLRRIVDWVGRFGSWFMLPLVLITTFDMGLRKTGEVQIWMIENISEYFGSTMLQEMEWHSHTILFTLVLGYGYIWNTHVRVDLVRETLAFKKKAWLEFLGLSIFYIPFCCILLYFATVYSYDAFMINEASASLVGLSHRWAIKAFLVAGILVAILAGISVWLQIVMVLFGPQNWRYPLMTVEWPEDTGTMVEGKERLDLEKAEDLIEMKTRERSEREG